LSLADSSRQWVKGREQYPDRGHGIPVFLGEFPGSAAETSRVEETCGSGGPLAGVAEEPL